jgi:hypothetical protein
MALCFFFKLEAYKISSADLWDAALGSLCDADRQILDSTSQNKLQALANLQTLAERARKECVKRQWKYTRNGKTVVLRDVFDKVLQRVEMFKRIVDAITPSMPISVALPWTGVGFLFNVRTILFRR